MQIVLQVLGSEPQWGARARKRLAPSRGGRQACFHCCAARASSALETDALGETWVNSASKMLNNGIWPGGASVASEMPSHLHRYVTITTTTTWRPLETDDICRWQHFCGPHTVSKDSWLCSGSERTCAVFHIRYWNTHKSNDSLTQCLICADNSCIVLTSHHLFCCHCETMMMAVKHPATETHFSCFHQSSTPPMLGH